MGSPWIVDADPGLGLRWTDVDDALAILHLHAAGAAITALTTCYGNARLDAITPVAERLGARLGVPVHRGARDPGDVRTPAVDALCAHRGSVLALAPLTNVAAALSRGARWDRLVVLGGTQRRLPNLRPLHTTELNLALDEPAAEVALAACTEIVPMEPCRTVWFDAATLRSSPAWLRDGCASWLRSSPLRTGRRAFHPWDLVAAVWITHPELFVADRGRPILASRRGWRGRIAIVAGDARVIRAVDHAALAAVWDRTARALPLD